MSRWHPQAWTVETEVERPDPALVAALAQLPTTQIADGGGPIAAVGPGIAPMVAAAEICGPAVTLWTAPGDILFILKSPDVVHDGDVLVVDAGGRLDAAVIGDVIGGRLQARGCVGMVVDGAVRDVEGLEELGLPVHARGAHPATGSNAGPGALNVPVQLGGVGVHPGDVVRADRSGVVVVRRGGLAEVLERAGVVARREEQWQAAFAAGAGMDEVLGIDALIAEKAAAAGATGGPEVEERS
ncbi:dimethylmenaquinone methyltransferase [Nostocoides sp. Soil756]|uniref:RraA family protein n=1 Tax=Nostocoides sp. Soil756 TaxID=1736399 RepID=UPI0006F98397|nr:dimethylmenaquinone methyltransferase [Tetrasphaera sp. Soil756]KRE61351.1 dimethylmenaquinone methyltransferase [Tetrasphaera sp. Soil756]